MRFNGTLIPPKLSAAPATPEEGQVYYNTTDDKHYGYNGTTWAELGGGGAGGGDAYSTTIGNGTADTFAITHNLNTEDVSVIVREAGGTKRSVLVQWEIDSVNQITVGPFNTIPTTNQHRVTVLSGSSSFSGTSTYVHRQGHTWAVAGTLNTTSVIPGAFIPKGTGQTVNVVQFRARIDSGTSVDVQLKKNGVNVGSASTITTSTSSAALSTSIADGDYLSITLSNLVGTPKDLSYTVVLEHTV